MKACCGSLQQEAPSLSLLSPIVDRPMAAMFVARVESNFLAILVGTSKGARASHEERIESLDSLTRERYWSALTAAQWRRHLLTCILVLSSQQHHSLFTPSSPQTHA
jgi:hypothetical protein